MFKFRKVRGPEQISEAIVTLEESANRLEGMVESAQKEKSRLHLLVGNVSDKMNQIRETAASFEKSAEKISEYESAIKDLKLGLESLRKDMVELENSRAEGLKLRQLLLQLTKDSAAAKQDITSIYELMSKIQALGQKAEETRAAIEPQFEQTRRQQAELAAKYDDFLNRLSGAESEVKRLSEMAEKFQTWAEEIARESARITTWMAATEKMAENLSKTTELFETASSKIDSLHELTEFVESKTKSLNKQKELLKNAHIEYGKANVLFLEIRSKLSEMEEDWEQIKQIQTDSVRFENQVKALESRIGQIEGYSEKLDRLAHELSSLDDKAEILDKFRKQLEDFSETAAGLELRSEQAGGNLKALETAIEKSEQVMNRVEQTQKDGKTLAQHLELLLENGENFLGRVPDINKIQDNIDSVRERALALENKLLENMAVVTELKNHSEAADQIKERLDSYRAEVARLVAADRKELESISTTVDGLKKNMEALRSRWLEMPDILARLAETDKISAELQKKYSALLERENEVLRLKELIEQNSESFRKFDNTVARVHQKASELLNFKADLESVDLKISAVEMKAKTLISMGEKIDQIGSRIAGLAENSAAIDTRIKENADQLETLKAEYAAMRRHQEDLRLDIGEVMDSFDKLTETRSFAELKSKELAEQAEKAEHRINQLSSLMEKWDSQGDEIRRFLGDLKSRADTLAAEHESLAGKFAMLDRESERIIALAGQIKQRHGELGALDGRISEMEKRLKDAQEFDYKLAEFERTIGKITDWMQSISGNLARTDKLEEKLVRIDKRLAELDSLENQLAGRAADIDRLTKQLNKISLLEKELKAREGTLVSERALMDKAIDACQKLEDLVLRAEHLGKKLN